VLIRTAVGQISKMGRATQGVSLISLDPGTKLAGIEKIAETEDENGNGANGDGHAANGNGHDPAPPRGNGEDRGD
jgi:DNA gyrase subunit A